MKSSLLFPSLLSLTLFLFNHRLVAGQTTNSTGDLVSQVCAKSAHRDFCLSSLQSDPNSETSDINGLAMIAIKAAATNGSDTSVLIKRLLNDTTLNPGVQQSLSDCFDLYLDAVQQLDNTVAALTVKAYGDVYTWVKIAVMDAGRCEDGFVRLAGGQMLLTYRNRVFRQLCNNALGIVKLLTA